MSERNEIGPNGRAATNFEDFVRFKAYSASVHFFKPIIERIDPKYYIEAEDIELEQWELDA